MASPVQPDLVASFSTFGDFLKFLRRRAHLTQLELSIAVGYSEAQISRLEQNQRLPDLTTLKALFIPALYLEHEPELTTRLLTLAESARQEDAPLPGIAPYKGLLFFDEADADLFFGREELTARLVERVSALARARPRLLAVVGASGSGKSSVLRAGLAVALKHAGLDVCVFTPTQQPLKSWAAMGSRWHLDVPHDASTVTRRCLVIVDQFEEIFTLCRNEDARAEFVERVLAAANEPNGRITIALALRADFYSRCGQYPHLRQAIAERQEYIGQMTREELRRAIEEPAKRSGWEFEPGLVDLMLSDVGAGGVQDQEPGALPLLSHALLATWERRRGRMFTLAGYRAAGGVRRAIAETAESVFTDQLNQPQQDLARDIFLRLTELGEGTEDTRRRAALIELVPRAEQAAQVRVVLNTLADARLVMLGEDSAEVAHEALIREWTRLREWLNENRDGLRLHRHLTEAAQSWQKLNHESGELYRGARLAQALEWIKTKAGELNPLEREFLDASKEMREREEAERDAQRQREMIAAQKLAEAERRRATILRWVAIGSSLLLVVMIGLAIFAFSQRDVAENEQRIAFARELSVNSVNNLTVDPERSILLALQAISVSMTGGKPVLQEAEEALHRAVQASRLQLTLRGHAAALYDVAFSPDGKRLATASTDKSAKVWDAATGKELLTLCCHADAVQKIAFSPDGKRLATSSYDKTAKIWDAATGKELLTLRGHADFVYGIAFSPDGARVATGSLDKTAKVWDSSTGKESLSLIGHMGGVDPVAFSPDGTLLATGSWNDELEHSVKVWDAASGRALLSLKGHASTIWGVAFSPDGRRLATGSGDATARIWDPSSGQLLMTIFPHSIPMSLAYGRDSQGTRLATGNNSGTAMVWDPATGELLRTLAGHTAAVWGIAFSPNGTRLATASTDGTARVWDVTPAGSREWWTAAGHTLQARYIAYSPDGTRVATASQDGTAKVWDAATGQELLTLSGHTNAVNGITFSPDASRVATVSLDHTAKVWDVATGKQLLNLPTKIWPNPQGPRVAFSPDGKRIATPGADNTAKIWDATTGHELLTISGHTGPVQGIAFSPDGTRLATGAWDRLAKVWDAATGKELLTLSGHADNLFAVKFSPDGRRIGTASLDGTAMVWDAATGKVLLTLSGHTGMVFDLAFSPDGTHLATASGDGTVKVWDVSTTGMWNEQPLTLYNPNGAMVSGVAFSPDGKRLAASSNDGTTRIYALPLDDIISIAKSRVTRALTIDECQKFLHIDKCP